MQHQPARRRFVQAAAAAIATSRFPILGANDRINIGIVGMGGRGTDHVNFYSKLNSEARIAAVRTGQKARITCDTFRDRRYDGTVTYVSSTAEFTPKNVQTSEDRVRLVYAVKVRVTGDAGFDLKPGMPADVVLETGGR